MSSSTGPVVTVGRVSDCVHLGGSEQNSLGNQGGQTEKRVNSAVTWSGYIQEEIIIISRSL